jgi:hypothetical protein
MGKNFAERKFQTVVALKHPRPIRKWKKNSNETENESGKKKGTQIVREKGDFRRSACEESRRCKAGKEVERKRIQGKG